ncbi:hypothetical protein CCR75_008238 [Bremia lactucae]|uniref:Uncharacterized protein n=1 Tax=Bremia lactucae TaxID=4779 RepID=A0A976ID94_BRELC|nr:hypothetical protein CCR75_008238 [Bremia lactucae]
MTNARDWQLLPLRLIAVCVRMSRTNSGLLMGIESRRCRPNADTLHLGAKWQNELIYLSRGDDRAIHWPSRFLYAKHKQI